MEDRFVGKAVFGGSFDPIHYGHIAVAREAYLQLPVDEVILIPTKLTYHKKHRGLSPDEDRLNMLKIAAEPYPYMSVSDIEIQAPVEKNYTVETLTGLRDRHPDWKIYYVIGGDSLAYIDTWKDAERLFGLAVFVTAVRGDCDAEAADELCRKYMRDYPGSDFRLLRFDPVDISSTDIRRRVKEGRPIAGLVPEGVEDYIMETGLYRS